MGIEAFAGQIERYNFFGWQEGRPVSEVHALVDQANTALELERIFKGRNPVREFGDINKPDSPYKFHINLERYIGLLEEVLGLTPEEIGRINIYVVGEGRLHDLPRSIRERVLPEGKKRVIGREIRVGYTGVYEDESVPPTPLNKKEIDASIYLFAFWHFFAIERKMILKYVKNGDGRAEKRRAKLLGKHMRIFDNNLSDLLDFLKNQPDLADERLRKLAAIKLRDEILEVTAHEVAAHLWDTNKDTVDEDQEMRKKLIARVSNKSYVKPDIMARLRNHPVFQKFLPNFPKNKPKILVFEDLAKAIEKAVKEDPKWSDLIDFGINPDWPFKKAEAETPPPGSA